MEKPVVNYEIISGYRKNSQLLLLNEERQIFKKKSVHKEHTRYVCYIDSCHVSVSLKNDGSCEQLSLEFHHNHAPPVDIIKKFQLLRNIKSACGKQTAAKRKGVREIFDDECIKDAQVASAVCYPKMRRQLQRIRNDGMPKNPNTPQELKLMFDEDNFFSEFGKSKHIDKPFYRGTVIENDFSYAIFVSPTISEIIGKKPNDRRYLIDGTFRTVPSCGYKQLLVVHYHFVDHVSSLILVLWNFMQNNISLSLQTYPFMYILMTKKSRAAYKHMFQFIDTNIFKFQASVWHTDYEAALRKALEFVFPNTSLKGCWFHYCQALRRNSGKIKNFGKLIKSNEECSKWYRTFLSLALVNPKQIEEMFLILKNNALEFSKKHRECLNIFIKYFEKQWMTKVISLH